MKSIFLTAFIFLASLEFAKSQRIDDYYFIDSIEIVKAQQPKKNDIRRPILGVIWSQFDRNRLNNAPENFLVFMVFGIEINSQGRVSALYTSAGLPDEFTGLMKAPANLKEDMKKLDYSFKGYENKILMFPLIMKKLSSASPEKKEMRIIDDIIKMWPELPSKNALPIVFLEPFFAPFSYHRN